MKIPILLAVLVAGVAPACAQREPFAPRFVSPQQAQLLAAPTLIALDLHDVTLKAALEELQRQSGVSLRMGDPNRAELATKLSLQLQTRSFGEAFAALTKAAGVEARWRRSTPNRQARMLWNRTEIEQELGMSQWNEGLFNVRLFELRTINSKTITLPGTAASTRETADELKIFNDPLPDLRLAFVADPITRFTRAQDDQGRSLFPTIPPKSGEPGWVWSLAPYNDFSWNHWGPSGFSNLPAPAPDARALRHLEGTVTYALVAGRQKWEVPDLLAAPRWKRTFRGHDGAFDVTIKPVRALTPNLELLIEIAPTFPAIALPPNLKPILPFFADLKIEDANGVDLPVSFPDDQSKGNTITLRSISRKWGAIRLPLKLTLDLPVDVVQTEVPFAFENVPLP